MTTLGIFCKPITHPNPLMSGSSPHFQPDLHALFLSSFSAGCPAPGFCLLFKQSAIRNSKSLMPRSRDKTARFGFCLYPLLHYSNTPLLHFSLLFIPLGQEQPGDPVCNWRIEVECHTQELRQQGGLCHALSFLDRLDDFSSALLRGLGR